MNKLLTTLLTVGMIAAAAPAAAHSVATFENLNNFQPVPAGYAGVDWNNISATDGSGVDSGSGYITGRVSGLNTAYNPFGDPASISAAAPFTFNSGYFTGAWRNGLTVTATGFVAGAATYGTTFTIGVSGPTFRTFNWLNLSSVSFAAAGGVNPGDLDGDGTQIVFDNLAFNGAVTPAVPEPGTWAMLIVGFGAVGATMRRRRTSVRTFVRFA